MEATIKANTFITKLFLSITFLLSVTIAFAQTKTVTGTVRDAKTKAPIAYATVAVVGAPAAAGTSTSTNANGEFKLVFPTSYVKIRASYVGYDNKDAFVTNDAVQDTSSAEMLSARVQGTLPRIRKIITRFITILSWIVDIVHHPNNAKDFDLAPKH